MVFNITKAAAFIFLITAAFFITTGCAKSASRDAPTTTISEAQSPTLIGLEYAMPGMAKAFGELGVPAIKQYPDEIRWDSMQKSAKSKIDFSKTDRFVKEYQSAGFTTLVVALKSHSVWASKKFLADPTPKKEYLDLYKKWVAGVVERYDGDGESDMPGLKSPVIYYEIGTEFSSYEPESAQDYLTMLKAAYEAAHTASGNVIVAHAAFLTTNVFNNHPAPKDFQKAFSGVSKRIMEHSLADIRAVLDKPEIFDAVNFHSLGDPYEIEDNVKWLKYEMAQRNYNKPILISDTAITPFAGYGPATICKGKPARMALLTLPAKETDRCRLADYFSKLIANDKKTLDWERAFAASDVVKRALVAAEQKVRLINMAFMEETSLFQAKIFHAAAGNTGWAGMTQTKINWLTQKREVVKKFPSFFALKQLAGYLREYESVERVDAGDNNIRWYKITNKNKTVQVIWYEPAGLILPGDKIPSKKFQMHVSHPKVALDRLIVKQNQTKPEQQTLTAKGGIVDLTLTPTPVFVLEN